MIIGSLPKEVRNIPKREIAKEDLKREYLVIVADYAPLHYAQGALGVQIGLYGTARIYGINQDPETATKHPITESLLVDVMMQDRLVTQEEATRIVSIIREAMEKGKRKFDELGLRVMKVVDLSELQSK